MRQIALFIVLAMALIPSTGSAAKKKTGAGAKAATATQPAATDPNAAPAQGGGGTTPAPTPAATPAADASAGAAGGTTSAASVHEVQAAPVAPGIVESPHPGAEAPHAQPKGLGLAVAAKVGGTKPTSGLGMTYMAALELSYAPPVVKDLLPLGTLSVGLEVGYMQPSLSSSANDASVAGKYSYALDQRLVTTALDAIVTVPVSIVRVYGSVGWGMYFLRAQVDSFGKVNTENQTRSGLQLRVGGGLALGPGDVFAEARYHYVGLEFLSTGNSNAGGVTLAAGYRYAF